MRQRRPATTLVEVLVSIFVMGIGLLSILALFPLGALEMAQAIQDSRSAMVAANAMSLVETLGLRQDPIVSAAFVNPDSGPVVLKGNLPLANPMGPSYPVYVDPVGYLNYNLAPYWVCSSLGCIPRRSVNYVNVGGVPNATLTLRWFGFLDDMAFQDNGIPPNPIDRDFSFSFALMMRRPRTSVVSVVDVTVVVYRKRNVTLNAQLQPDEYEYTNTLFDTNRNVVTLDTTKSVAPGIKPGNWILDSTRVVSPPPPAGGPPPFGTAHGYFYRVLLVTETSPGILELEIQTPLREFVGTNAPQAVDAVGNPLPGIFSGTAIVMPDVVEVFEKGTGRTP